MINVVMSSHAGHSERDAAVRLLTERAILTRAVCQELLDSNGKFADRRPIVALSFLLQWIVQNLPNSFRVEPRTMDGIDQMVVPDGCEGVLHEIRDGALVCDALFFLLTADSSTQARSDEAKIRNSLAIYWENHRSPVRTPTSFECSEW